MSYLDELEKLGQLRDKGLLTNEEFEIAKSKLLPGNFENTKENNEILVKENVEKKQIKKKFKFEFTKTNIIYLSLVIVFLAIISIFSVLFLNSSKENEIYNQIKKYQNYYPIVQLEKYSVNVDTLIFRLENYSTLLNNYLKEFPESNNSKDVKKWKEEVNFKINIWQKLQPIFENKYAPINKNPQTLNDLNEIYRNVKLDIDPGIDIEKIPNEMNLNISNMFERYNSKLSKVIEKVLLFEMTNKNFFKTIDEAAMQIVQNEFNGSNIISSTTEKIDFIKYGFNLTWKLETKSIVDVQQSNNGIAKFFDRLTGNVFGASGSQGKVLVSTTSLVTYNESKFDLDFAIISNRIKADYTD